MSLEINSDFFQVSTSRESQLHLIRRLLELAKSVKAVEVNDQQVLRCLTAREIHTLEATRCTSSNWSTVCLLVSKEKQEIERYTELQSLVSDTRFDGLVILDMEDANSKSFEKIKETIPSNPFHHFTKLPPGVHSNLMVCDSIVSIKSCRIYRNSIISNTFIGPTCMVVNCGFLSTTQTFSSWDFGKLNITVGPESGGGRRLVLAAENTMIDVCRQIRRENEEKYPDQDKTSDILSMNILSKGNVVCDTPTVQNVYLHESANIHASTCVTDVTMFPDSLIGNSCTVSNCLLQWNSAIVGHSTITNTLLMEQSHCGPSSVVTSSIMGPDVHTSAGEVHASVIGPNTNAHHQSLVIGALWCLGRGNVGYGANVGSNHTGRLPDQEAAVGEGTFWGLSCVIKFPVDLTFAPYSVVAAGTTLTPQRVCMPFSLIVEQENENIIIPGWVIQSSPYTLARSEKKYATRRKAKRHNFYTGWQIQNQSIIEMCQWARNSLKAGSSDGIGANKLTERARNVGISAYSDYIQHYALRGLFDWLCGLIEKDQSGIELTQLLQSEFQEIEAVEKFKLFDPIATIDWPSLPWEMKGRDEWAYQKTLLKEEFLNDVNVFNWIKELLSHLVHLEKDWARRIHKSKDRDDTRGVQIIPGYKHSHVSASDDPVILEANKKAQETEVAVSSLMDKLSKHSTIFRL